MELIITIASALFAISISVISHAVSKQSNRVDVLEELEAKTITKVNDADRQIENIITIHNSTVEHYDNEIDQIIAKMQAITEAIARIDHDEKEIRSYYVNFREPKTDEILEELANRGVPWSEEYTVNEDDA